MDNQLLTIHKLAPGDSTPFHLLLLADETKEAIEKYIYSSDIYTLHKKDYPGPIGVCALCRISEEEVEIKNIAVLTSLQGAGTGTFLIQKIIEIACVEKYRSIVVGTADSGEKQIRFYEKNGFETSAVKKDFYINNYEMSIVENGNVLRDMVMLRKRLV